MKWNYICPLCNTWRQIDWSSIDEKKLCHTTNGSYLPPRPAQQHIAYVDTHPWPQEMEEAVVDVKGNRCTVPGCSKKYETLDHRVPYSQGGRTSVSNLFPMCTEHNQSKNDSDYQTWLATL